MTDEIQNPAPVEAVVENPTVSGASVSATDVLLAPSGAPNAIAATTPKTVQDSSEDADGNLHRLFYNLLHIFGKAEHWTAEEIEKAAVWLKARI